MKIKLCLLLVVVILVGCFSAKENEPTESEPLSQPAPSTITPLPATETNTAVPTNTIAPTDTAVPTNTATSAPTDTVTPSKTPTRENTPTTAPTNTLQPTNTIPPTLPPLPSNTPLPLPSNTPLPLQPTDTPVIVPTDTPLPPPPAPSVCDCSGDVYNCTDFTTHAQAQACFDYCVSQGVGDIHGLDRDNDGDACESLP